MSTEAIYRQGTCAQQDYTPASAAAAGEIIQLGDGRAGVVACTLAASAKGAVYTSGIFDVLCATGVTFAAGAPVYWDVSGNTAIAETSAEETDFRIGTCVATKTTELVVRVDLNIGVGQHIPGLILSHVVEIDTETDTDVHTLIPAAWNKSGMLLLNAFGIVTEVFGGGTEDQGIITLKDTESSPNTICTLTPSNAGADALKDVVQASGGVVMGASTGGLMVVVAAGKGVTATCTQAVTGTSAAGKLRVQCIGIPYYR